MKRVFGYSCLSVAVIVMTSLMGCPVSNPNDPAAEFGADITYGDAPLTVQFTDLSIPGDSPITTWLWSFGDGGTSDVQDPTYIYTDPGTYNVSLTIGTINGEDTEKKLGFISVTTEGGTEQTISLPGDVPLTMVWIPAGSFMMGRYTGEQDSYSNEDPQHLVTVRGFWMAKYELTKRQWSAVMNTTPWSGEEYVLTDLDSPAVYISWNDAQSFITALNSYTGKTFRLPSEAEWEYACRAETTTRFYWGDDSDYLVGNAYCWWEDNTFYANEKYAHVVGQKLPNNFGLYDMSGNVWEWCQDFYHSSYTNAPTDGSSWVSPSNSYLNRVRRGGSWADIAIDRCCSAHRSYSPQSYTYKSIGFRLAR